MDAVNLRGAWNVGKKRRSHRNLRPETITTGARWTNIPNPNAKARFSVGDRVAWDEGDRLILGIVEAYIDNESHMVIVRLESGVSATWPTISPRFRRVQTPDRPVSVAEEISVMTPTPTDENEPTRERAVESGYYDTLDVSATIGFDTVVDIIEHEATMPDGRKTGSGQ